MSPRLAPVPPRRRRRGFDAAPDLVSQSGSIYAARMKRRHARGNLQGHAQQPPAGAAR